MTSKKQKSLLKAWANKMRPFAEKHKNPERFRGSLEEQGYEELYADSRVTMGNIDEFEMTARLLHGAENQEEAGITYARSVTPYQNTTEWSMNANLASRLIGPVIDWADALDLGTTVLGGDNDITGVSTPCVFIRGRLPARRFNDYIALVKQVENHLDWNLKLEDERMVRPYNYALLGSPWVGGGASVYKEINYLKDLEEIKCVLVARYPLPKDMLFAPLIRGEQTIAQEAKKVSGKVMSVDEFVKRKR